MKNSRIKNAFLNSIYGIISYLLITIVTFFSRRIFADFLGAEYLGLNSLFTNVITMLSLSELGLGTAILHFLYRPVANNDSFKIQAYMNLYKKIYISIAISIILIGSAITLIIPKIANTMIPPLEVRIFFVLFFINTAVSYLWSYKQNILYANQKNRVISIIHTIIKIMVTVLQILAVITFKNYILFLSLQLIGTIIENLFLSTYVNKLYPYLNSKEHCELTYEEKIKIYQLAKPLFIQNLSGFFVSSTDNIIISYFISSYKVGIYSNYALITATVATLFSQIYSAFTTSFGNLFSTQSNEKSRFIFEHAQFLCHWLATQFIILFLCIVQPFISLWLGESFIFENFTVFLIGISTYIKLLNVPSISVQNALGLHKKDEKAIIIQAIVNLILSITLVQLIGVNGVLIGTIISTLFIPTITKPFIIYKYAFHVSPQEYYYNYCFKFIITMILLWIFLNISQLLNFYSLIWTISIRFIVVFIGLNATLCMIFLKNPNFNYYYNLIRLYFKSRLIVKDFNKSASNSK